MSHVDDGQLNALLDGELPEVEANAALAHLAACAECRLRYDEAKQFLAQAADLLGALELPTAQPDLRTSAGAVGAGVPGPAAPAGAEPPRRVSKTAKEVAVDIDGRTQKSPAIRPVFPRESERHAPVGAELPTPLARRPRIDITTLAWAASIVLALGVGYLAREVRLAPREAVTLAAAGPDTAAGHARVTPPAASPVAEAAPARTLRAARPRPVAVKPASAHGTKPLQPDAAADAALLGARAPAAGAAADRQPAAGAGALGVASTGGVSTRDLANAAPPPAAAGRMAPAAAAPATPPRAVAGAARDAAGAPAAPTRTAEQRTPEARAAEPLEAFRRATTDEAVRRLGGTIRLLDGMFSDQVEVGPGHLVNGADPNHDVVRVVYTDALGRRLILEEQRLLLPADTSAAARLTHLMNAVGMTWGDTLLTAIPSGTARIRWVDRKNFWVSLTGSMPPDSLRAMLERIR
jgi:hypothetical protein